MSLVFHIIYDTETKKILSCPLTEGRDDLHIYSVIR